MPPSRLPSLKLLQGFEAAARLGHYGQAADELSLSQSAISHQIAQLEAHIGQPLFRRKGRGVELTVAGRLFHDSVIKSLEQIRAGLDRIDTYMDEHIVTLVCPAPVVQGWLQPRLDALQAEHPALCLIVSVDESARYVDELDVDISISHMPLRQPGVTDQPLMPDALVPVCSEGLALRLEQAPPSEHAAMTGLLSLESDLTDEHTGRHLRQHFGHLRRSGIYDDPRLLLDAVQRGRGVALLSRLLADESLAQGRLRVLTAYPGLPRPPLWISRIAGPARSALVSGVFDSLCRLAARSDSSDSIAQLMNESDQ